MTDHSTSPNVTKENSPEAPVAESRLARLFGLVSGNGPRHLVVRFWLLAVVAGALIVGLSALGMSQIYRTATIRDAEMTAVAVGAAIFANEREHIVVRDSRGNEALHVPADQVLDIDRIVRNYLGPFHIRKIKIFAGDKRTIYSSDHGLIGRIDSGNETLDRVLRERVVDSSAKQKNQMTELGGTIVENRQIVETYLPIISGERVLGAFEVYVDITETVREIGRTVLYTALFMAVVVAAAMLLMYLPMRRGTAALLAAHARIDEMATTDPLTRVLNRSALVKRAEHEIAGMKREGNGRAAGIGLVMIDIDGFKEITDRHGRAAGDQVLQATARRLEAAVRKGDLVGRYGDQEFLVLLPSSTRLEAQAFAERLRVAIGTQPVELPDGKRVEISASFGIDVLDHRDQDFDSAVRRADEALYWARQSARNRPRSSQ